jgi:hypothetical protein
MFAQRDEIRRWLEDLVEKFRQRGAVSPETAKTSEELGLPPRFQEAMKRRLGRSGIFIEVNGKYYLDEKRLEQIQAQRLQAGSRGNTEGGWSRSAGILLILPIGLIVFVALYFLLFLGGIGLIPGEFLIIIIVVLVVVAFLRILFWRSRRQRWREQW